jgi:glycosyltransferase involved in cell wall biosynthesis
VLFNCAMAYQAAGLVKEVFNLNIPAESNSKWISKTVKFVRAVWRLSNYLRRTKPDLVHAILPASNILTVAAGMLHRIPILIGSRRSLAAAYRTTQLLSAVDRNAARRCNLMLGNSEAIVRELIDLDGVSPCKAVQIPNGVDTGRFRPGTRMDRLRYGWMPEQIVLGMIANFIPYKRHIDFILEAEQIAQLNRQARFVMVGEDRGILDSLKGELRARGLATLVTVIPGTSEPEKLYHAMDVYVCTSETEGLSNVLLEAGASGLPVVATRVGGNPEIVIDGYNGFLFEPRAVEELVSAAMRLANNPGLRSQMGLANRERMIAQFSVGAMVKTHEELYERALSHNPARLRRQVSGEEAATHGH